jgi:hypothetical protein
LPRQATAYLAGSVVRDDLVAQAERGLVTKRLVGVAAFAHLIGRTLAVVGDAHAERQAEYAFDGAGRDP